MKKKHLFWLAVPVVAAIGWFSLGTSASHSRIDVKEAQQLVQGGARLVDVRTPTEFATKHLPSAINIPVQQLSERLKELEPKDQGIVLYCRSGHRSGLAYDQLRNAGFTKLYDLGPMTPW
jgi:phage shock protein E